MMRSCIEQVHVVPGDDLLLDGLAESPGHTAHNRLEPRGKRAQDTAGAHLGTQKAQLRRAGVGELEVVDAHHAHSARVHDLLVEQVARDEDLVGLQVGEADVGRHDLEGHLVLVERLDVLAPADHERGPTRTLDGQCRHAWEDLSGGDAEVGHPADALAFDVINGIAQQLGQIDHANSSVGRTGGVA